MKNILITGGAGFIGCNLALKLLSNGYNVRVLDNLSIQIHGVNPETTSPLYVSIKDKVDFIHGDITNKLNVEKAVKNQNIVIHLASETGTGQSMYKISRYIETNVLGTALLLEECLKANVKRFILSSSRAVYGEGSWYCSCCGPVHPSLRERQDDSMPTNWNPCCPLCGIFTTNILPTSEGEIISPTSVYGVSKATQEQLVALVGKTSSMSYSILRFFNVFGPGQALDNPYTGVLGVLLNRARAGKHIDLYEDGEIMRDFVYVDDVVESIVLAMTSETQDIYNIGGGYAVTIRELAEMLTDFTTSMSSLSVTGKMRIGDVRGLVADISHAEHSLKWRPSTDFSAGLRKFIEWALQREFQDRYEESLQELRMRGLYR